VRTWDRYLPDVLPEVIGCPNPTATRHLLRAAQRFCEETGCWRVDLDPVLTSPDMQFDIPSGARIARLWDASVDGRPIDIDTQNGTRLADRKAGLTGCDRLLTSDRVNFTILPTPADGLEVIVAVSLMPTDDAAGIPDEVGDEYSAVIAKGALSTLLAMNNVAWQNIGRAGDFAREFGNAIDTTAIRVARSYSSTRPRARVRTF
jgi:hypothetical protein